MARYNAWANARLLDACIRAGEDECARPRPSFFGSILVTLNHVMVGDLLWMGRFTGRGAPGIDRLDQTLHSSLARLVPARTALDDTIVVYFDGLDDDLGRPFTYRTMAGAEATSPLGPTMLHMFNHATHHRGQVHGMLSGTAVPPPALDLVYFLRG